MRQFEVDAEIADRLRTPREGTGPPFSGLDVSGFVPRADLGTAERRAILGVFPRKSLWPELDPLDEKIGELQQRLSAAQSRASALMSERVGAPERDADGAAHGNSAAAKALSRRRLPPRSTSRSRRRSSTPTRSNARSA